MATISEDTLNLLIIHPKTSLNVRKFAVHLRDIRHTFQPVLVLIEVNEVTNDAYWFESAAAYNASGSILTMDKHGVVATTSCRRPLSPSIIEFVKRESVDMFGKHDCLAVIPCGFRNTYVHMTIKVYLDGGEVLLLEPSVSAVSTGDTAEPTPQQLLTQVIECSEQVHKLQRQRAKLDCDIEKVTKVHQELNKKLARYTKL